MTFPTLKAWPSVFLAESAGKGNWSEIFNVTVETQLSWEQPLHFVWPSSGWWGGVTICTWPLVAYIAALSWDGKGEGSGEANAVQMPQQKQSGAPPSVLVQHHNDLTTRSPLSIPVCSRGQMHSIPSTYHPLLMWLLLEHIWQRSLVQLFINLFLAL